MPLTRATAQAIAKVVSSDAECIRRIAPIYNWVPASWGVAGALRNWGYVATGENPIDPKIANTVCTGIADATSTAINKAVAAGRLAGVTTAGTIDRTGTMGVFHTATLITLSDGTQAVFDWHATLRTDDPMISKVGEWKTSTGGSPLSSFSGF